MVRGASTTDLKGPSNMATNPGGVSGLKGYSGVPRGSNIVLENRKIPGSSFTSTFDGAKKTVHGWSSYMSTLENSKLAAAGSKWSGGPGIATGVGQAPNTAIPTTAAQFVLANGNAAAGKCYVMDRMTILQLSGTAAVGSGVVVTIFKAAAPAMGTGMVIINKSASNRTSNATVSVAQTLTTASWFAVAANGNPATSTNGGFYVVFDGDIIIPPGWVFGVAVISGTGTSPLNLCWFEWSEQLLTLQ